MGTVTPDNLRLRVSTDELCDVLQRIRALHEELLTLLGEQESALVEVRTDDLPGIREREEALLRRIIEEEKDRLLITEEVGDLLDHEVPSAIKVGEMLPHLPEDLAARLSDMRERLRDVAVRLARQNSLNRALIEHSIGHIQIFMSKLAQDGPGGAAYDKAGGAPHGGGGADPFLMDRRG